MAKRTRAPGGGRKPKGEFGGKSAWLSTRITEETREKLEAAAAKSGRSLSQEIEARLKQSFGIQQEGDPQLKAIGYLLRQLTIMIGPQWYSDPWAFSAFRAGTNNLLESLSTTRVGLLQALNVDTSKPPEMHERLVEQMFGQHIRESFPNSEDQRREFEKLKAPEVFGRMTALLVTQLLRTVPEPPLGYGANVPSGYWPYALPQARQALGLSHQEPAYQDQNGAGDR
jgi:TraY domain